MRVDYLLHNAARRTPDQVALVFEDQTHGYAGLERRAAKLAGALLALGLKPGERLALLAPNSPLITDVLARAHRLAALEGRILTVGARRDQMIQPASSAFLDGFPSLELREVAHAGSLLDRRVHEAVARAASQWLRQVR